MRQGGDRRLAPRRRGGRYLVPVRVLMSSSLTFASARPDAQVLRSHFGAESGAPRRRARAELYGRSEGELARGGKRIRPLRTLAARLAALRAPLHEKSSDFGLLCAQVCA